MPQRDKKSQRPLGESRRGPLRNWFPRANPITRCECISSRRESQRKSTNPTRRGGRGEGVNFRAQSLVNAARTGVSSPVSQPRGSRPACSRLNKQRRASAGSCCARPVRSPCALSPDDLWAAARASFGDDSPGGEGGCRRFKGADVSAGVRRGGGPFRVAEAASREVYRDLGIFM